MNNIKYTLYLMFPLLLVLGYSNVARAVKPTTTTTSIRPTTTTTSIRPTTTTTSIRPTTTTTSILPDSDNDGIPDSQDNCPEKPNGTLLGTCTPGSDKAGVTCNSDADCVMGCSNNGNCSLNQEDTNSNGVGDVCEPPTTTTTSVTPTTSIQPTTTTTTIPSSSTPQVVGFLHSVGTPQDVAVDNGRAYIASGNFGLTILDENSWDVINASAPIFTGRYIAAKATRAVVTGSKSGIRHIWVLNTQGVSSTIKPVLEFERDISGVSVINDVAINTTATRAVLAVGSAGIRVIDLTNPNATIGICDTPGTAYGVTINAAGTRAYVADGSAGVRIIDLSTPSSPREIGSKTLSWAICRDIALNTAETVVFMPSQTGSLEAVNISNPSAPVWLQSVPLSGYGFYLAVDGTQAAVISGSTTSDFLELFDISNPAGMTRQGQPAVIGNAGIAKGLDISGDYMYVATGSYGLKIYRNSGAPSPSLIGTVPVPGDATGVTTNSAYAYTTGSPAILSVVQLR